jgi:hypothetical protein
MQDFKIRRGLSTVLFSAPGVVNSKLVIEEGCWYLCTDTAELFLGVNENGTLKLVRINGEATTQPDTEQPLSQGISKVEINDNGELVVHYTSGDSTNLGRVVGKDGTDGLVTSVKIGDRLFEHSNGIIELPEFITEELVDSKISAIEIPEVPTRISELQDDVGYITSIPADYITKEFNSAFNRAIRYEVLPHEGMLIDYRDSEIRVNTSRVKPTTQQAGPTAPSNQYYVPFRAYAPEGAVAFREWQGDTKDETIHTFDESFAGTDKFGRNYSLIWMSIASFDGKNWSLYGDRSTIEKYLGFYYTFEWLDADSNIIDTGKVRIILTNDTCHNDLVPDAIARRIDNKVTGLATESFVSSKIAEAQLGGEVDLSNYATKEDIKTFISEVPSEYVTEEELSAKGYLQVADTEVIILNGGSA